jgi:hypothetical protein
VDCKWRDLTKRKGYLAAFGANLLGSVLYNVCLARACLPPYSVASPVVNTAQILSGLFDQEHKKGSGTSSPSPSLSLVQEEGGRVNLNLALGVSLVLAGVCVLAMEAKA